MAVLANLLVFLGLDSAKFSAGLDEATKKTRQFEREQSRLQAQASANASALLGRVTALAGGLLSIQGLLSVFQKVDSIVDVARAFDTTAGSVVAAQRALQLAGGKAEDLSKIWGKLAVAQDGAREGSEQLRKAFAAIGITGREVENLNPDELFERVATQLAQIEDPALRNAKAFELLGKSAKNINWQDYVDKYKEVFDPELEEALNAMADLWEAIEEAVLGAFNNLVKLLKPFAEFVTNFIKLKNAKNEGFDIDYGAAAGEGISSDTLTFYPPEGKEDPAKQAAKAKRLKTIKDKLKGKPEGYTKPTDKEAAELSAIRAAELQTQIQERQFGLESARLSLANERYRLNEFDAKLAENNLASLSRITALEDQQRRIRATIPAGKEAEFRAKQIEIDNIQKQIEYEKQLNDIRAAGIEKERERAYSFQAGWDEAYRRLIENNDRLANRATQVFATLESGFDQVLDKIVGKSKASFSDIAKSIIQDLIKIQLKAQAIALIKAVGGGGGGSIFGKIFSAAVSGFAGGGGGYGASSFGGPVQYAANGGYIDGPTIVGERGIELFTPKTAGTITPNHMLGQTTNVTYNINALDSRSFEQRLSENPKLLYGITQEGQRQSGVGSFR